MTTCTKHLACILSSFPFFRTGCYSLSSQISHWWPLFSSLILGQRWIKAGLCDQWWRKFLVACKKIYANFYDIFLNIGIVIILFFAAVLSFFAFFGDVFVYFQIVWQFIWVFTHFCQFKFFFGTNNSWAWREKKIVHISRGGRLWSHKSLTSDRIRPLLRSPAHWQ